MPKDIAEKIPLSTEPDKNIEDSIVYAHFFGVIGDWYICSISEDHSTAFGYRNIETEEEWETEGFIPNGKEWGNFSISYLQSLVNKAFLKEKDIRFLIVRDIYWEPIKFSSLKIDKVTLNYPGNNH